MAARSASSDVASRDQIAFSQVASRKLRSTVSAKSPPGACALLRRIGCSASVRFR